MYGWEARDLRRELEALWAEREKRLDERWHSQEAALTKAASDIEARLHVLNELRGNVLSRDEYDAKHNSLNQEIAHLKEYHDQDIADVRKHHEDEISELRKQTAANREAILAHLAVQNAGRFTVTTAIALLAVVATIIYIAITLLVR